MLVQRFEKPKHKKTRNPKVQKIKLQECRECWVCGSEQNLESHHAFGAANRPISERYGLKAYFCHNCHNENIAGNPGIHYNKALRLRFKQEAQRKFEEVYSMQEFKDIFKVGSYL